MATTPVYGWPTPDAGEPPDVPTDMQELAEAIEGDVERIDGDIAALDLAPGWHRISNGSVSAVALVDIDLTGGGLYPAGTFGTIRLRATGYMDTAGQIIHAQINNQTGGNYRVRRTILKMTNGPALSGSALDAATAWQVGIWGTLNPNSLLLELYRCSDNIAIPYYATSLDHNSDGQWFVGGGRYNSAIIPDSVQIFPAADQFGLTDGFLWELEGFIRG